jgi:hypothetical protein
VYRCSFGEFLSARKDALRSAAEGRAKPHEAATRDLEREHRFRCLREDCVNWPVLAACPQRKKKFV